MPKKTKQERDWEAESDARTLAEASEIMDSRTRHQRAVSKAKEMARKAQQTIKRVQQPKRPVKRQPVRRTRKR